MILVCLKLGVFPGYGSFCVKPETISVWEIETVLEIKAENIGNSLNNHRVRTYGEQGCPLRYKPKDLGETEHANVQWPGHVLI